MVKEYKDWLFVKVPEDANSFQIDAKYNHLAYYEGVASFQSIRDIQLPPGSWQIIGKGDAVDWDGIVDKEELFINGVSQGMKYKDYKTEDVSEWFNRCKDSKKSLLRSLDMEPETTLILKKNEK